MKYKLIAFDLDGTFLKDDKTPPQENVDAVYEAYEKGMILVPTTGRVYSGIPEVVRKHNIFKYCILANGADIYDVEKKQVIYSDYINIEDVMPLLDFLDTIDCKYDGFQNDSAYMNINMYNTIENYTGVPEILKLIRTTRIPVEDLRATLIANDVPIQKITAHFSDQNLRHEILKKLPEMFPNFAVTTSIPNNIEINNITACKGNALKEMCRVLGIDISQTVTFGDGLNDISMIEAAGLGVAMKNATKAVLDCADIVTDSNNEAGVAKIIRQILAE